MMRHIKNIISKTVILLSALLTCGGSLSAQPSASNYVRTVTALDEESGNSVTEIQYYDPLGRPCLSATNGLGESGRYAYSLVEYNEAGLVKTEHPVSASTSSSPETPSAIYVRGFGQSTYGDQKPYTIKQYDALGRQVYSCGPGNDWHNQNKHVSVSYGVNSANSVKVYTTPTSGNSLVKTGRYYPAGTLRVETTTDEDGHQLQVFTDRHGHKVLERRGTDNDTYFVYNDFGQLRFVLSPQYQQQGDKAPFAYEYRYDDGGRMVKKILPGCEYIQYWYDKGDRLMFMQDARLRAKNRYRFYFYDKQGRLAVQGLCSSCNRGDYYGFAWLDVYEDGLDGSGYFTTKTDAVSGTVELELCNYYDDYKFLKTTLLTDSGHKTELTLAEPSNAYGQLTGHVSRLSDGTLTYQAYYYDDKGQLVETRTTFPDGRLLTEQTTYSFTGKPLTVRQELRQGGSVVKAVTQTNTYGIHNDMLKTVSLTVGNGTQQTVAAYTYDGVGRRTAVQRGGSAGTVGYTYNVRNWVTAISSPDLTERLYYTDGPGTACYGGNVSSMTWKTSNETVTRGYRLTYDNLSRLANAAYGEGSGVSGNTGRYDEKVVSYNKNGAPTRLQRGGKRQNGTFGLVDDLSLSYNGNRLMQVSDAAPAVLYSGNFGFTDNTVSTTGVEYGYDGCGSLVWDANKGVSHIGYDLSGMPRRIQFSAGHTTEYVYDADGRKLRTVHRTAVPNMSVPLNSTVELVATNTLGKDSTDYVGSFILRQGQLDKYLFDGGYVTFSGATPQFHYYGKDHLGNNRTVVNSNGTVEQVTHYYPFGGVFGDVSLNASTQEYKYNGKELDHTHGLDWYDYGARNYDAALWQWNGVDMLAEKYYHISPYVYCADNPVNNIDIDGLYPKWNGKTGSETAYYDSETGENLSWSQVYNYIHYGNYDGTQTLESSDSESSHTITPYRVGVEWLTGKGERNRTFVSGDVFTEMLRDHEHISKLKKKISKLIASGILGSKSSDYKLSGIGGVGKYIKDYSTLLTFGLYGNLAATYLGSYGVSWSVIKIEGHKASVLFEVNNSSTIQSGTRPPVIGYTKMWQNTIGKKLNDMFSSGPMSPITQKFVWVEKIDIK